MEKSLEFLEDWCSFLRQVSIFSDLEGDSLKKVAAKLKQVTLPKGTVLYREGDPGDALYIIQSGRVRILGQEESGKEKILNFLGRGDTFGETALLTGASRSVTVKLDSNAHFLVLYKKDFETFLKNNPTASFYLSQLLSRRLLAVSHPFIRPSHAPEVLGFFSDLNKEDEIVFIVNLCLALTEQTKRKILLVEVGPLAEELIRSLGLNPQDLALPKTLEKLQEPKNLEKMILVHPSGLEILQLNETFLTESFFHFVPEFLEALRQMYNYVIVNIHGKATKLSLVPELKTELARAFLEESDSVYYVSGGEPTNIKLLYSLSDEKQQTFKKIVLGEKYSSLFFPVHFVVPWEENTTLNFKKGNRPYLDDPEFDETQKVLNRIARSIGKIQVGFAMGSGAAYGYSLIGILKVFEKENIPIDFVSGTSMGALLGSFFASGKSPEEIEQIAHTITKIWIRRNVLSDLNLPGFHGGMMVGQTISKFLKSVLGQKEFKDLKIPFSCTATNIMTGDGAVFREGKVWQAVRASLSLPLIFCPYKIGDHFYVDGGLVNPVPSSTVASMGADILISVNLTGKASEKKVSLRRLGMFPSTTPGIFNIFSKMLYTMEYQIASGKPDLSHIVIHPNLKNFSWIDFHKAKQIIPLGEEAAEEALTKIKSRLPFFSDTCRVNLKIPH